VSSFYIYFDCRDTALLCSLSIFISIVSLRRIRTRQCRFPTADTDTAVPFPYGGYGHGSAVFLRRIRTRQCRFPTADTDTAVPFLYGGYCIYFDCRDTAVLCPLSFSFYISADTDTAVPFPYKYSVSNQSYFCS
jgi:hypothetical protein